MTPSEATRQRAILGELARLAPAAKFWRANTGAAQFGDQVVRFGERGQADVQGLAAGRFIGIECKTEAGRLSKWQRAWRDGVVAAGGLYIVARHPLDALRPVCALLGVECPSIPEFGGLAK